MADQKNIQAIISTTIWLSLKQFYYSIKNENEPSQSINPEAVNTCFETLHW